MKSPFVVMIVLLVLFILAALLRQNYEFLFYASTLIVIIGALFAFDRSFNFSGLALWGFNGWLLMHLAGGMAQIDGVRLYDVMLLELVGAPYDILKYDQFVHVYCYVVMAMLVWQALSQLMPARKTSALLVFTILAASGIGGLNEVIEFSAVVIVGSTGVGDYTNTALDLVANLLGAVIGAGYMSSRKNPRRPQP